MKSAGRWFHSRRPRRWLLLLAEEDWQYNSPPPSGPVGTDQKSSAATLSPFIELAQPRGTPSWREGQAHRRATFVVGPEREVIRLDAQKG